MEWFFYNLSVLLANFQPLFSSSLYIWFVLLVVSFMVRSDKLGVTSGIRALKLDPMCYTNMLNFFHNKSWNVKDVQRTWARCVAAQYPILDVNGKCLLVGDATQQEHHGKKMIGVKKYPKSHDKLNNEYIHGRFWGNIGVLCSNLQTCFCVPLQASIQGGVSKTAEWEGGSPERADSHVVQVIRNGGEVADNLGRPCIIALDRLFHTKPLYKALDEINKNCKLDIDCDLLTVVTRAKMNCVAYQLPPPKQPGQKGRPRKKGDKVVLSELFKSDGLFTKATVKMYGRREKIQYYCTDLLWGPGLWKLLRFVLVKRADGSNAIFVCTDTTLDPVTIVGIYSLRFKVEIQFRSGKQTLGTYFAKFWSKVMPPLNRFKKKGDPDPLESVTDPEDREALLDSLDAVEKFAALANIGQGLLQGMALDEKFAMKVNSKIWHRTKRHQTVVSEATVRTYLQQNFEDLLQEGSPIPSTVKAIIQRGRDWSERRTSGRKPA